MTIFWFDNNGRYYWIYWLVSLNLVYDTVKLYYQNKWNFIKKYISKEQLSLDKYRAISDFISGMTDRYAINLHNNTK